MLETLSVSVILPAYNEGDNILSIIIKSREVLSGYFKDWEIIVVDDGSKDNTRYIVEKVSQEDRRIRIISHVKNVGYGGALRTGFRNSRYNLIFFTDSDSQFDMEEIRSLLPYLEQSDMVAGYRIRRADPMHRLLNAWLYNWLVKVIFRIKIRDVNCAFKFIKRDVLDAVSLESNGALINAELLYKARKKGFRILETGVHHYPRKTGSQTGARPVVVFKMFFELLKWRIKWGGIG